MEKTTALTTESDYRLSPLVNALLDIYQKRTETTHFSEQQTLRVSKTVSFFAFLYEKARNAIEYREEHLIRRAAIERILKRRLLFNNSGQAIAEALIRELLWARYLKNSTVPESRIDSTQKIIDKYLFLRRQLIPGRTIKEQKVLEQFILELLTCEVEEVLAPAPQREAFNNFVYHSIVSQVTLFGKKIESEKNILVYIAVEQGFAKSDTPLIRYHLVKILLPELIGANIECVHASLPYFMEVYKHIEATLKNPFLEKLRRFIKRNAAPYLILRDLIEAYPKEINNILRSRDLLRYKVDEMCRKRYAETKAKLTRAGVRSVIYIFLTKMVFALLLEIPVDRYLEQRIDYVPLTINIIVPPFLMFLVVALTSIPGEENTKRVLEKLSLIINKESRFEKTVIKTRVVPRRPLLTFGFSILYLLAFLLSFGLIFFTLSAIKFNIVSQLIFIFFASMILFFGYRIRQTAKEYLLVEKESIFSPIVDFFMLPILSVGKWLSNEISRLNIFIFIFDFIIEAPFKAIFEIGEEWINFVKTKKEEFT